MKTFITFAVLLVASLAVSAEDGVCHNHITQACSQGVGGECFYFEWVFKVTHLYFSLYSTGGPTECNSRFGGISKSESNLNAFLKKKLATSYDYMLLQTHFDSYQKNRPGFKKLFNGLSDQAWDETVALIKHVTKRGGVVDFAGFGRENLSAIGGKTLEVDELHALALALDSEKQLGNDAIKVHQHASHMNHKDDGDWYDPELTQFMEEKFLENQATTIRKLSGYANDLKKLMSINDPSLNVYLFDEYLAKQ